MLGGLLEALLFAKRRIHPEQIDALVAVAKSTIDAADLVAALKTKTPGTKWGSK
jgi:hypothetical protein